MQNELVVSVELDPDTELKSLETVSMGNLGLVGY